MKQKRVRQNRGQSQRSDHRSAGAVVAFRNSWMLISLFFFHIGCSKAQSFPAQSNAAIIASQFEKWEDGSAPFFDLLDEQVVWEVSGNSPVSGIYNSKAEFMDRAVTPITNHFKSPLVPELISLTEDKQYVWLHFRASAATKDNQVYENYYVWKLQLENGKITKAVAFLDTYQLVLLMNKKQLMMEKTIEETKDYIGMWVTQDGQIRHELLPGNRYDEARGNRKSAYQGNYQVTGNHIDYQDDTGFTADGEFRDGILYHAGMVLYKEEK